MDIKQLIIDTYNTKPKHFSQILKRNKDVLTYIKENVPVDMTSFLEQLYYIVYEKDPICEQGNRM